LPIFVLLSLLFSSSFLCSSKNVDISFAESVSCSFALLMPSLQCWEKVKVICNMKCICNMKFSKVSALYLSHIKSPQSNHHRADFSEFHIKWYYTFQIHITYTWLPLTLATLADRRGGGLVEHVCRSLAGTSVSILESLSCSKFSLTSQYCEFLLWKLLAGNSVL